MAYPVPKFVKEFHHDVYPAIDPTREELSAKSKSVVITGGGSGIGPHIAEAFAKAGAAQIALLGRTEKTLASTKQSLESKYPVQVSTHIVDVSEEITVNQAFQEIASMGPINVLVSNAGYLPDKLPIADSAVVDWLRAYEVNVKGALFVTRAFMKNAVPNAVLINISAGLAHAPPMPGFSAYSTSKISSAKMFEYVQFEEPGLRVFNLHPGVIPTDMGEKAVNGLPPGGWDFDTHQLSAHFSVWLASPEGTFLKGKFVWANWDVDELKANAKEIESTNVFTTGVHGI